MKAITTTRRREDGGSRKKGDSSVSVSADGTVLLNRARLASGLEPRCTTGRRTAMSDRSTRRAPCGVIHRRCLVHGHYVKREHDLTRKERGQKLSTTLRSRYRTCICCLPVGWKLGRRANLIGTRWILTKPSARVVWRATVREGWSLASDDDDDGRDARVVPVRSAWPAGAAGVVDRDDTYRPNRQARSVRMDGSYQQ